MPLLTFPGPPLTNGQLYPSSPLAGQNQYQWDSTEQTWKLLGTATGVIAGTYGDALNVGQFTVDATGKITFAQNVAITGIANNPAGADSQVQFNDNGVLGASASFTWNNSNNTLAASKLVTQTIQTTLINSYNTNSNFLTLTKDSFGNGRELKFSAPSGVITLTTGSSPVSYTLKLPNTQGNAGTALLNDGSGNLSWSVISATAAGSNGQIQFNNAGLLGANANLRWNNLTNTLTADKVNSTSVISSTLESQSINLVTAGSGSRTLKFSAPSGSVSLTTSPTVTTYALTLPGVQGVTGSTLINNGAGFLRWGVTPEIVPVPSSSSASGSVGQIAFGGGFFYWFDPASLKWLRISGSMF